MKLITSLSIYVTTMIFVGFSGLFVLIGDGFFAWPQHANTVLQQFAVPKRAPFALLIVLFVIAVPTVVGLWHWRRLTLGKQSSPGSMAGRTFVVSFGLYAVMIIAATAMANAAPAFSVMEGINLKFGIMLLGAWSALATVLAIPTGAAVNRLLQPKPPLPPKGLSNEGKAVFAGMTVNERLFYAGTVDRWDAAVRRRDRAAMIALLTQVEVVDPDEIVDAVLANPHTYGF
jgi:hypothetical protein